MRRVIAAKERGVPAKRPSAVNDAAIAPRGRRDADDGGPSADLRIVLSWVPSIVLLALFWQERIHLNERRKDWRNRF
jgi:hypothetical protein